VHRPGSGSAPPDVHHAADAAGQLLLVLFIFAAWTCFIGVIVGGSFSSSWACGRTGSTCRSWSPRSRGISSPNRPTPMSVAGSFDQGKNRALNPALGHSQAGGFRALLL
jgi:hypothetical protein